MQPTPLPSANCWGTSWRADFVRRSDIMQIQGTSHAQVISKALRQRVRLHPGTQFTQQLRLLDFSALYERVTGETYADGLRPHCSRRTTDTNISGPRAIVPWLQQRTSSKTVSQLSAIHRLVGRVFVWRRVFQRARSLAMARRTSLLVSWVKKRERRYLQLPFGYSRSAGT
jgi:hypothetical protein